MPIVPDAIPLDYLHPTPKASRTRFAILLVLSIAAIITSEELTRRVALPWLDARRLANAQLNAEAQCLSHLDPPDQLVLVTSGSGFKQMHCDWATQRMTDNGPWLDHGGARGVLPVAWQQELNLRTSNWISGEADGAALVHELHCQNGTSRIVGVDAVGGQNSVVFLCSSIIPGRAHLTNRNSIRVPKLRAWTAPDEQLRVYAAQLDPSDPAAFSIRCVRTATVHDKPQDIDELLDGRLNPDGTVSLTPRVGFDPHSEWELLDPTGQPLTPWNSPLCKIYGGGARPATARPSQPQ